MKKLFLILGAFLFVVTLSACGDLCVGAECVLETEQPEVIECEDGEIAVDGECTEDTAFCNTLVDETCSDGQIYVDGECIQDIVLCEQIVDDACPDGQELDNGVCVDEVVAVEIQTTLLPYDHINGHGVVVEREAVVLYEYALRDYVKYQISYLSCTCRDADLNYWQMMYVELDKTTNEILVISFGSDGGHYTSGMWGDSSPTPSGKTLEDFEDYFIPWLVGKTKDDLEGISLFKIGDYHGIQNDVEITDAGTLIDDFAGSSVSTNNMIRAIKVLLDYHDEKY